jgi:adenylate cyclase
LEELPNGCVRLDNLSGLNPVYLEDGQRIDIGSRDELLPPLNLKLGQTTVSITSFAEDDELGNVRTILATWQPDGQPLQSLRDLGDAPSAQTIAQWLEMALELQQSAEDVTDLFIRTARAMVELLGFDVAYVLNRDDDLWNVATHHARRNDIPMNYSRTLLRHMVRQGQTLIRNKQELPDADSFRAGSSAAVSPIYGVQREVVGALYGLRSELFNIQPTITALEAQVLQLFAVAASNRRVRAEATRVRIQFEQFFSPELVRELQSNVDLLEGREREITVLVCDLRGFSRLSERLGPQKTCQLIRDLMDRFTSRIIERGGVIVDYAGDGILAMWNSPVLQADHAVHACRAAIAMRNELPSLNKKWEKLVGEPLSAGIGINTGNALVGNTGSSRKLKYGPHGTTVNLASRLQDATKVLGLPILITNSTQERLPPEFATRHLFAARLRGITEVVGIYELCGTSPLLAWSHERDIYELALDRFEQGDWCKACQDLVGLMQVHQSDNRIDIPTVRLLRHAWECLECRKEMEPVIDLT